VGSVLLFYVWFFNRSNLRHCINCASVISCLKFCTFARCMLLVVTRGKHYKHCVVWVKYQHSHTQCAQLVSWLHTTAVSTSRLTPHTGFIQSFLLMMGIMMPETCWVNLLWINIYTCVICWFFLLLYCVVPRFSFHILWNSVCWFRICRVGGRHWTSCTYIFSTMPAVTFRTGNVGWLNCCYRSQVKSVSCNFKSLYHYLSWHVNIFLKINFLGMMLLSHSYIPYCIPFNSYITSQGYKMAA